MNYKTLILVVVVSVISLTSLFFILIYFLFQEYPIGDRLKESLTLTIYFFSGISTLGSVLAIIYSLYRQSIEKRPHFLLEITNYKFFYDDFINKNVSNVGINLINTGENAFTFSIKLNHEGIHENIKYGFHNCRHQFDVFKSISETEKHHYLSFNINFHSFENIVTKINNLKLVLMLNYRDKNHCIISEKYSITACSGTNNIPIKYKLKKI